MLYDATIMVNGFAPSDPIGHYLSEYKGLDEYDLMTLIKLTFEYGLDGYAISLSKSKEQEPEK